MASEESTETADALEAVLTAFKAGSIDGDEAARQIRGHFFTDLGHTVLDTDRAQRPGSAEVIFGAGKPPHRSPTLWRPWSSAAPMYW